jgi:hypothetical protein
VGDCKGSRLGFVWSEGRLASPCPWSLLQIVLAGPSPSRPSAALFNQYWPRIDKCDVQALPARLETNEGSRNV